MDKYISKSVKILKYLNIELLLISIIAFSTVSIFLIIKFELQQYDIFKVVVAILIICSLSIIVIHRMTKKIFEIYQFEVKTLYDYSIIKNDSARVFRIARTATFVFFLEEFYSTIRFVFFILFCFSIYGVYWSINIFVNRNDPNINTLGFEVKLEHLIGALTFLAWFMVTVINAIIALSKEGTKLKNKISLREKQKYFMDNFNDNNALVREEVLNYYSKSYDANVSEVIREKFIDLLKNDPQRRIREIVLEKIELIGDEKFIPLLENALPNINDEDLKKKINMKIILLKEAL